MKTEQGPAPSVENPASPGETTALAYIARELPKARQALKRGRITGLILIAIVGCYMAAISLTMSKFFQPKEAAQVASGMLVQHIESAGPALAVQVEREIPLLIRHVPDYILGQLPAYRTEAEKIVEAEFQTYCDSFSRDLGTQLDKLISEHKADIKTLLESANDRAALRKTLPDLGLAITSFLKTDSDGRVISQHVADLAAALKEVEKRMDRLANGANLTPEEKKARRSVAMLAKVIQDNSKDPVPTAIPVVRRATVQR